MIIPLTSERAVREPEPVAAAATSGDAKWSRSVRIAVAVITATASWAVVVGAGYLIFRIF